ncbi:MAG: AbrB/MazE/SpoVT family DNA-binding domain-containing protein [bacterium]
MPNSTVSSKGQVTIPKEVRDALRLDAGDRVEFIVREDGIVELRPDTVDLLDLVGILTPPEGRHASVEDMKRGVEQEAARAHCKAGRR